MHLKSIGYHGFNLFALVQLRQLFPSHNYFNSKSFESATKYITTPQYRNGLVLEDFFGFGYNLAGLECLSVMSAFGDRFSADERDSVSEVVAEQFARMGLAESDRLAPECFDLNTYIASCYKALI